MILVHLFVSLILICCGFLVKKYPDLIAGYNTLPQEEKGKIDIKNLSQFLKYLLIGLGLVTLLIAVILYYLNVNDNTNFKVNTILIFVTIIVGSVYSNKKYKL